MLHRSKHLTEDEEKTVRRLLMRGHLKAGRVETKSYREALYILLLLETGARARELRDNVCVLDVDENKHSISYRTSKGGNDRTIGISPRTWKYVRPYLNYVKKIGQKELFKGGYYVGREFWAGIRPSPKGLHSLRHTFGINTMKKKGSIHVVQAAMGHKDIKNTMIYLDHGGVEEELLNVYKS